VRRQGFLRHDEATDRYRYDWREGMSLATNEMLLRELLAARPYMRGRLLDMGCGRRPYALIYDGLVESSVGTEVTFSPHGTNAADAICFGEALPFEDASFDTILCTEVLEHTREPWRVMAEFVRLLRPGGHVLISVPFTYPLHEQPHDYWRFTGYGLEEVSSSAGLETITIHARGGTAAALFAQQINLAVRGLNLLSKLLRLRRSLRDYRATRFLMALPQWLFMRLHPVEPPANHPWMTVGLFMVARKPAAEPPAQ
jgi:SAM-dependent methyltransferase